MRGTKETAGRRASVICISISYPEDRVERIDVMDEDRIATVLGWCGVDSDEIDSIARWARNKTPGSAWDTGDGSLQIWLA